MQDQNLVIGRCLLVVLVCAGGTARAGNEAEAANGGADASAPYKRVVQRYKLPPVALVDQDGRIVPIAEVLPRDATIALNFIFTGCKTICPSMTRTQGALRKGMGGRAELVQAVSITIDPVNDTPERLRAYVTRAGAQAGWRFYTGEPADVEAVRSAFAVTSAIREAHPPITLLRAAYSDDWVRLEGLFSAEQLRAEILRLKHVTHAALDRGEADSP